MSDDLMPKIGLDTTAFKKGVMELSKQMKQIETSFRASAAVMGNWSASTQGLSERTESLRKKLDLQKEALNRLHTEYDLLSKSEGNHEKEQKSLADQMYNMEKKISSTEGQLKKYGSSLQAAQKDEKENSSAAGRLGKSFMEMAEKSRQSTSNIREHFNNLKSSISGAIAGIVAGMSLKEVIEDTDAAEKNLSQMSAVLKSTGDASGMTKEQLVGLAEAQSKVTTYSAETTEKAENMLLTFTNLKSNVFPQAIQATEDMATAMHMDATQAALQLGKALNDPAKGYTKLQRIGVTFTASQIQTIKAMEKAGNTAGAQKIILQELEKEYGSSAKAAGSTLTGQIQIMQNNVKSAGVQIMGAVLPIVQNILPSFVKGIQGLATQVMAHKAQIVAAFTAVGNGIKTVFGWIESHGQLVKNLVIGIASAVGVWKVAMLTANVVQAVNNALTVKAAIAKDGLAAGEAALAAAKGNTTLATMALSAATIKNTASNIAHAVAQGAATVATNAATVATNLLNAAMKANPIGIVITLIAALVAALVILFNHNKAFHNWVLNAFAAVKSTAQSFVTTISGFFTQTIPNALNSAKSKVIGIWNSLKAGITSAMAAVKTGLVTALNSLKAGITAAMNKVKAVLTAAWNGIATAVKAIVRLENGILDFWRNMQTGLSNIMNGIKTMLSGAWKLIKNIVLTPVLLICDLVTGNFSQMGSDLSRIWTNIQSALKQIWDGITQFCKGFTETLTSIFQTAWQHITSNITLAWNNIVTFFTNTWNTISNGVKTFWNALPGFFSNLWQSITSGITNAWTTISNLCNTIKAGIINIWNSVVSWFQNLPGTLHTVGANMFTSMQNGVNSTINNVVTAIKTGIGAAIDWIKSLPSEAVQWGKDLIDGIANGIKSAADHVKTAVGNVAQNIRDYLHFSVPDVGPLSDADTYGLDFMQLLADTISKNSAKPADAAKAAAQLVAQHVQQVKADLAKALGEINTRSQTLNAEETKALQNATAEQRAAIQAEYNQKRQALSGEVALRKRQANQEITEIERIGKASKDELDQEIQDRKNFTSNVNSLADEIKSDLKKKYDQEEQAQEAHINKQLSKLEDWKTKSEDTINDVYSDKIQVAENAANATTAAIQKELDALDAQKTADSRAETRKGYTDKISDLKSQIKYSHGAYNTAQLQKQLTEEQTAYQKELDSEALADKKAALNNQMAAVKTNLDQQKAALQEEQQAELGHITKIYNARKKSLNNQLQAVKNTYSKMTEDARLEAQAEQMIMKNSQDEIISLLNSYSDTYKLTGQTLGDKLAEGFRPAIDTIKSEIASIDEAISSARNSALDALSEAKAAKVATRSRSSFTTNNNSRVNNINVNITSPRASSASQQSRQATAAVRRALFQVG